MVSLTHGKLSMALIQMAPQMQLATKITMYFGLDGSALVTGTVASDASYTESADIESRIATLGDLADVDGNGQIDALTDGLLTLRYLFGLEGDTLIDGVVASDATRTTAVDIEAHLKALMLAL